MAESTETILRAFYEDWNAEATVAFERHCSPDLVWHDDPEVPDASTREGLQAAIARLNEYVEVVGHFQTVVREIGRLGDGRHYVVITVTIKGEGSGIGLAADHLHVIRMEGDRVAEMWQRIDAARARQ